MCRYYTYIIITNILCDYYQLPIDFSATSGCENGVVSRILPPKTGWNLKTRLFLSIAICKRVGGVPTFSTLDKSLPFLYNVLRRCSKIQSRESAVKIRRNSHCRNDLRRESQSEGLPSAFGKRSLGKRGNGQKSAYSAQDLPEVADFFGFA